jgi:MmeI, target recognition domain
VADPRRPGLRLLKAYVGGEDLYADPSRERQPRYVFDVDGLSSSEIERLTDVRQYLAGTVRADLLARGEIQETTVEWWHFRRPSIGLREALGRLPRLLVCSRIGNALAFSFLPPNTIANEKTVIFAFSEFASFAVLQGRIHELWTRLFSSTLKDDLQYTPSDCFDTFPFPDNFEALPTLEQSGREYYEFRAALMLKNNEGLTATYNRFHDPEEESPDILQLRELHAEMDRAVLDAYGWTDIQPRSEFLLDYEEEEDEEDNGLRRRKKPWRYRWPDEIRDEVLARLLELNRQRAIEEGRSPAPASLAGKPVGAATERNKQARPRGSTAASKSSPFGHAKGVS